jgi:hypothetical protein
MSQDERSTPAGRRATKTEVIGPFRITPEDRAEITRRARERNMHTSVYVTGAALNRLDPDFVGAEEAWRDEIERRLERLESLAFGTS